MTSEIGKFWYSNLIEMRALVRELLNGHKLEDFSLHILKKENLIAELTNWEEGICYECFGPFNDCVVMKSYPMQIACR